MAKLKHLKEMIKCLEDSGKINDDSDFYIGCYMTLNFTDSGGVGMDIANIDPETVEHDLELRKF